MGGFTVLFSFLYICSRSCNNTVMFIKRYPVRALFIIGVLLLVSVGFVMGLSTPDSLGPVGITTWFIVLFTALSLLLASVFLKLATSLHRGQKRHSVAMALRRSILVSLFSVSLLALSSLHQLSVVDIVLVILLVVGVEFYFFRRFGSSYE